MPNTDPDMSSARDVIRRSAQLLRQDAARYAAPALTFNATPTPRYAPRGGPVETTAPVAPAPELAT